MQLLLALPLPARLTLVFVIAAVVASLLNAAIYQFAWRKRLRSPWQSRADGAAPRTWLDHLPIVGWWFLRRESQMHGTGHWIRPMFIEIGFPLGLAWLYWWETEACGLFSSQAASALPGGVAVLNLAPLALALHLQFLAHAILIALMVVATFIDVDDRIIPDVVTVPGTLVGLALATFAPLIFLPQITQQLAAPIVGHALERPGGVPALNPFTNAQIYYEPVHLAASSPWPDILAPAPNVSSLAIAMACYWLWCFAFVRRRWLPRRGFVRAVQFYCARVCRDWWTFPLREITLVGTVGVFVVWWWGGPAWVGLLTALVGLVGSGGTVWLIRIMAGAALRREAMGFGDVLLMMMVGTFIGWQAGVLVFFLAPFAALLFGIVKLMLRREDELPYGPFLCMAVLFVIIRWDAIWLGVERLFAVAWLVPCVLLVCLVLCGAILAVWLQIKIRLLGFSAPE
ncbi:MAG: prepilin peptidase [Aeoliella sp.]